MREIRQSMDDVIAFHKRRVGIGDEEANARLVGFLQFMRLFGLFPDQPQVASEPVDEFWHDCLLFTEKYGGLCREMVGGLLHHRPVNGAGPSGYLVTRALLELIAGESLDCRIWPQEERSAWSEGYLELDSRLKR